MGGRMMKNQEDVSLQRGMPVDMVNDAKQVSPITGEVVQMYYYNAGVLTADAGQAAGVVVVAKLANSGILNAIADVVGSYKDTSLTFTSTALTTEVRFPFEVAEAGDDGTGTGKATQITSGFTNGQYCVDYRTGLIYGVKASVQTTLTGTSYKVSSSLQSPSTGPTANVAGTKSNNAAVPGATNLGVLPGVANAATQTWIEGDQVLESMDLSGNQRQTLGTKLAGEDLTNDVIKVEERFSYTHITAGQATSVVKSGAGFLHAITFNGAATATNVTTLYDNTAASGTVIGIPVATSVTAPTTVFYDVNFSTGLTILTATANGCDMTVSWR